MKPKNITETYKTGTVSYERLGGYWEVTARMNDGCAEREGFTRLSDGRKWAKGVLIKHGEKEARA